MGILIITTAPHDGSDGIHSRYYIGVFSSFFISDERKRIPTQSSLFGKGGQGQQSPGTDEWLEIKPMNEWGMIIPS